MFCFADGTTSCDSDDSVSSMEIVCLNSDGEEEKEWEVEKIVCQKWEKGKTMYRVKWKGWSDEHSTWEPLSNLTHCSSILKEFRRQQKRKN